MSYIARKMQKNDVEPALDLFSKTVHFINAKDYTERQITAWASKDLSPLRKKLLQHIENSYSFVVLDKALLVGFITLSQSGYLDYLFVHKDYQSKGIASLLLNLAINEAQRHGIQEIHTHASITARPFFQNRGFSLIAKTCTTLNQVDLTNYHMRKILT